MIVVIQLTLSVFLLLAPVKMFFSLDAMKTFSNADILRHMKNCKKRKLTQFGIVSVNETRQQLSGNKTSSSKYFSTHMQFDWQCECCTDILYS
jgi:hypothetical protein